MDTKLEIAKNWLPRYTGMPLDQFGEYILITNFKDYVTKFSERFSSKIHGEGKAMQASTNSDGLTIINYGIGSPNAATIMDLLVAVNPKGVLFLGKCGGLKDSSEIGNFILPIGAIRGDGTSNDYFPPEVPALPSFKLHKFVSDIIVEKNSDYRTGLHYASKEGYTHIVRRLLNAGANYSIKDDDGLTAAMLASMYEKEDIVALFKQVGVTQFEYYDSDTESDDDLAPITPYSTPSRNPNSGEP